MSEAAPASRGLAATADVFVPLCQDAKASGLMLHRNAGGGMSLFQPMGDGSEVIVSSVRAASDEAMEVEIRIAISDWLNWSGSAGRVRVYRLAEHHGLHLTGDAGRYRASHRKTGATVVAATTLPEIARQLQEKAMSNETGTPVSGVLAMHAADETPGAHQASQLYDDGRPYNREVLTAEVRHHLGQGVLAMLEAGKRLIVLKEHEEHGAWLPLLERIGIGHDTAKRMMRAARKFVGGSNSALVPLLSSVTQVYELAMLDDDDLAELREGGTIAGATLDDIQRMSPTELRTTLRRERAERADRETAQRERLATKDRELEEAETKLAQRDRWLGDWRSSRVGWEDRQRQLWMDVARLELNVRQLVMNTERAIGELYRMAEEEVAARDPGRATDAGPVSITLKMLRDKLGDSVVGVLGGDLQGLEDALGVPLATEGEQMPLDHATGSLTGIVEHDPSQE